MRKGELRELYGALLASEARHFGIYWLLCSERYGRKDTMGRLQEQASWCPRCAPGCCSEL